MKKLLIIAVLLLSLAGSAGQVAAGGHGTTLPPMDATGVTWE